MKATIAVLLFILGVAVIAVGAAVTVGVDALAEIAMREPTASDLVMASRTTAAAPIASSGGVSTAVWGLLVILIMFAILGIGIAYLVFGEKYIKQWRMLKKMNNNDGGITSSNNGAISAMSPHSPVSDTAVWGEFPTHAPQAQLRDGREYNNNGWG